MATAPDRVHPAGSVLAAYPPPAPPAAADVSTELEEFQRYLDKQMTKGIGNVSVDAVLAEFRLYQDELRRLREELRAADERCDRGEAIEWNLDVFLTELDRRLDAKGIDS